MRSRIQNTLQDAYRVHQNQGAKKFIRGAFRYSRQRLPIDLWPPLLYDPISAADKTVRLHENSSIELRYNGRFRDSLPRQLAAAEGNILGAEGEIYVYTDAEVIGRRPIVGVKNGYFPPSWLGVETAFFIHQEKALKRNLPLSNSLQRLVGDSDSRRTVDTGFLLLGERSLEFPAWHHEVLPKLRWLEEYKSVTGESPKLILNADLGSFHKKSLRLMGYDPTSCITTGRPISVRKLIIPPHPRRAKGTHLHTTSLDWVKERMLSNLPESTTNYPDRIYISRQDALRRRVKNENMVIKSLKDHGFEWFEPGRLSYEQEIHRFAGANKIVGAHGKGLASIFFADDASLLELFPERGATEHYFLTAQECGFDYEFLTCKPQYDDQNIRPRDRNLIVDVENLLERITDI